MEESYIGLQPGQHKKFEFPEFSWLHPDQKPKATIEVTFGPDEVFPRLDAVSTLKETSSLVLQCLLKFQDACVENFPQKFK